MGDAPASNATWGWHFMGQRIFAAGLQYLSELGLAAAAAAAAAQGAPPPRLIVAGCSAGSRGAMMNADYAADILESAAGVSAGSVEVVAILDSPLWIDVPPLLAETVSLQSQTQQIYEVINASARMGEACAAKYERQGQGWKCLFGQFRLPTLETPALVNAARRPSCRPLARRPFALFPFRRVFDRAFAFPRVFGESLPVPETRSENAQAVYDKFQLPWNIAGSGTQGFVPATWGPDERKCEWESEKLPPFRPPAPSLLCRAAPPGACGLSERASPRVRPCPQTPSGSAARCAAPSAASRRAPRRTGGPRCSPRRVSATA